MHNGVSKFFYFFLAVALLAGSLFLSRDLQKRRLTVSMEYQRAEVLALNPKFLQIVSGDFAGIAADYFLLKAVYFVGGAYEPTKKDWDAVAILYEQALQLDPYFFSALYYVQGTLAWVPGMIDKTNEIIGISHKNRYWDWQPGFFLGINEFYINGYHDLAAKYLKESAERPDAPEIISFLAAKMSRKNGQTQASIELLQVMLEGSKKDDDSSQEIQKRLLAYQGLLLIENAIELYKKDIGTHPNTLSLLITEGFFDQLPANPYGEQYWYNGKTGELSFFPLN